MFLPSAHTKLQKIIQSSNYLECVGGGTSWKIIKHSLARRRAAANGMVMNESERGRGARSAGSSSASKYRSRNTHTVHHHRHYNIFLVLIHECNAGESGERGTVEERARRSMTAKQLRRRVKKCRIQNCRKPSRRSCCRPPLAAGIFPLPN